MKCLSFIYEILKPTFICFAPKKDSKFYYFLNK